MAFILREGEVGGACKAGKEEGSFVSRGMEGGREEEWELLPKDMSVLHDKCGVANLKTLW